MLKNNVLTEVYEVMVSLGAYDVYDMIDSIIHDVKDEQTKHKNVYYDLGVRGEMFTITLEYLGRIKRAVDQLVGRFPGSETEKILGLASQKFRALLAILVEEAVVRDEFAEEGGDGAAAQKMMNITFVVRKSIARRLTEMIRKLSNLGKTS